MPRRPQLKIPSDMRWRDRSGTVHSMTTSFIKGVGGGPWCLTVCGEHNGSIRFENARRCTRPVNCMACIGYEPTLPR